MCSICLSWVDPSTCYSKSASFSSKSLSVKGRKQKRFRPEVKKMDGETRFTVKWGKQWGQSLIEGCFLRRALGLKTKITFLIVLIVAGVLFLSGYLDFHLARKAHIDLYLDRNLYI